MDFRCLWVNGESYGELGYERLNESAMEKADEQLSLWESRADKVRRKSQPK